MSTFSAPGGLSQAFARCPPNKKLLLTFLERRTVKNYFYSVASSYLPHLSHFWAHRQDPIRNVRKRSSKAMAAMTMKVGKLFFNIWYVSTDGLLCVVRGGGGSVGVVVGVIAHGGIGRGAAGSSRHHRILCTALM